jgi:putative CocE/NonD family hydrolase
VSGALPKSYIYDPNDPCPTTGGGTLLPPQYNPGPVDQAAILSRRDVLLFTSAPLADDLEVTGAVIAILYAATSGRDTDWVVKLCDVQPDGRTIGVCDGVLRASFRDGETRQLVDPGAVIRYEIDLWSTSMLFKAGHRLALVITSSDFPRYDRNPNTGELAHTAIHLEPAMQRIFIDTERATHIRLPVVANATGAT